MERRVGFWKEIHLLDHDIKCKDFDCIAQKITWNNFYYSQKPSLVNIPAQS